MVSLEIQETITFPVAAGAISTGTTSSLRQLLQEELDVYKHFEFYISFIVHFSSL